MLTLQILHQIIKEIYALDDKYIVPISSNWFVPNVELDSEPATYIGYRILNKKMITSGSSEETGRMDIRFRLSYIGKNAEFLSDQVHFWNYDSKICKIFASHNLKVRFDSSFSYPMQGTDEMCWIVDFDAYSDFSEDLKLYNQNKKRLLKFSKSKAK